VTPSSDLFPAVVSPTAPALGGTHTSPLDVVPPVKVSTVRRLALTDLDLSCRIREIRQDGLDELSERLAAGDTFPPISVFVDSNGVHRVVDGFHRVEVYRLAGITDLDCDVRSGNARAAFLAAIGANRGHGFHRSNEDKRRAVLALLTDPEWTLWSNRVIAKVVGVSHTFVSNLRPLTVGNGCQLTTRTTANGRQMDVSNIGRRSAPCGPALMGPATCAANDDTETDRPASGSPAQIDDPHNFEWYSPNAVLTLVRQVIGGEISLDPASCPEANKMVRAQRIFTQADDGLAQDWTAPSVFLNPPFARIHGNSLTGEFITKADREIAAGHVAEIFALVPGRTESRWFDRIWAWDAICFFNRRLKFHHGDVTAPGKAVGYRGCVMAYRGPNVARFRTLFSAMGHVVPGDGPNSPAVIILPRTTAAYGSLGVGSDGDLLGGTAANEDREIEPLAPVGGAELLAGTAANDDREIDPLGAVDTADRLPPYVSPCGRFEIRNGDCRSVLAGMDPDSVDLIVTSPPYADRRASTYGGPAPDDYVAWFLPIAEQLKRVLRPDGSFILNIKEGVRDGERLTYGYELVLALKKQGWRWVEEFPWVKANSFPGRWPNRFRDAWERCYHFTRNPTFTMNQADVMIPVGDWAAKGGKRRDERQESSTGSGFGVNRANWAQRDTVLPDNVLRLATETTNKGHSAVFPVGLPAWFVKLLSNPGDLVLDPFCGSGTTGVASLQLGRRFIGVDLKPDHFELAVRRIQEESPAPRSMDGVA
jgi:site-specific DNA-methyltransferase (adenine-specific)